MSRADWIKERFEQLAEIRTPWESLWQDCADYVLPRKNDITTEQTQGRRRNTKVYDSTAINANRILAAGLQGGLSSPSRPWFRLGLEDEDLVQFDPVKTWLETVERIFTQTFYRSNFYTQIHECYLDLGAFGTPCVYVEHDPRKALRFGARHIAEIFIAEDALGRVDTVFRRFGNFTARQAVQQWGRSVGENIWELAEKKPDQKVKILHAVFPRHDRDPHHPDRKNMPWASIYMDLEHRHIIHEGGYEEFPFMVARWSKNSNEVYGRSPAMDMLPEIMTLNEMRKTVLKAGHKQVDPPIFLPDDGFLGGKVRMTPGSVNYYRSDGKIFVPNFGLNVPLGEAMLEDSREQIRAGFFTDLFLAIIKKRNMTATEVQEIGQEKMLLLGPTLGRLLTEIFDPLFDRAFAILARHGYLPPPPAELQGRNLHVEYISPLALAQKANEMDAIAQTYQFADLRAQFNPEILDNLDDDANIRKIAELSGMSLSGLRPQAMVRKIREARAQAQAEEMEREAMERNLLMAQAAAGVQKEVASS
ncbi:MAG: head-tail connector protein [Deltaproteobacteria bacterium]|nr:head-tail connector protein [Deltaproteobacteria bacterium]